MKIELIKENEYNETSKMIERSVKSPAFSSFYPACSLKYVCESLTPDKLQEKASWTHFYVAKDETKANRIIGCGAIGPYWDHLDESSLFSIFVDPNYQKQGVGKKIVETLENDIFFKRAKWIEVPASMAAIPFYKKMGYEFKNNALIYDDGHFALEKFNENN